MTRTWSPNQEQIFAFIEHGQGNAIINAVAGSGKSTTIVEGMRRVPMLQHAIFLAFNKAIADELKGRGVNARTFHSLTYSPVLRYLNAQSVDTNKTRKLLDMNFTGVERRIYGSFASKLVSLAKQVGIGCLHPGTPDNWMNLVVHHDLEVEDPEGDIGKGIEIAQQLLDYSNESNMADFDDLLYLSVLHGISLPKFDFVFVDEAQDTNAIQRAVLRKIMKPVSRMVAVGDPAQAIYGFRGADSNSLTRLADDFNCSQLPLTVTYRCPTSVVNYARQWVDHIEAAPGASEGLVENLEGNWNPSMFQPEDLVICRTTKPLLALGYRMLKGKIPVRIMGREIGQGLVRLVQRMKCDTVDDMLIALAKWEEREVEKAVAKQDDSKAERLSDQASAIRCIADGLDEDERTLTKLEAVIESLFNAPGAAVTLCTIHKSKGLEAKRVYWLNRSKCPSKWARQEWMKQQEANLCYVVTTRAKEELYLIEDGQ